MAGNTVYSSMMQAKSQQLSDGTWRAWFPRLDLEANAATEREAIQLLDSLFEEAVQSDLQFRSKVISGIVSDPDVQQLSKEDYEGRISSILGDPGKKAAEFASEEPKT